MDSTQTFDGAMRRPNFFIVGAAKSGTTSMLRYLAQHPDISMPQKREPIYFGSDLHAHRKKTQTADEYLRIFAESGPEKIIGEKSVWYLFSQSAAEEIREFDKSAKIMIMLRNPTDMIYSLHQQFLSTGNEDVASFDEAVALIDARAAGRSLPEGAHFPDGLIYTGVPRYSEQVERYFKAFGRDQVQVICFDDFARNTQAIYGAALDFLNVSPDFTPEFRIYNKKKKPRRKWMDRIATHPPRHLMALPKVLRDPLLWRLRKYNSVDDRRRPMSPETRACLEEKFRPEVERLSRLLDRDFSHWCGDRR